MNEKSSALRKWFTSIQSALPPKTQSILAPLYNNIIHTVYNTQCLIIQQVATGMASTPASHKYRYSQTQVSLTVFDCLVCIDWLAIVWKIIFTISTHQIQVYSYSRCPFSKALPNIVYSR